MESSTIEADTCISQINDVFANVELNYSSCMLTTPNCTLGNSWDLMSHPESTDVLNQGNALFGFACRTSTELSREDLHLMEPIVNLSDFADEVRENNVPRISVDEPDSLSPFTYILCKAMYGLPDVSLADITAELISSFDYQRACQQASVTILETDAPRTFRFTKPIIPYVYSITVQMRCTEFTDLETRQAFRGMDGSLPDKVVLLERTKRDPSHVDQTAKAKSVLLYYSVSGGLLVSHHTVVANRSIPRVAEIGRAHV